MAENDSMIGKIEGFKRNLIKKIPQEVYLIFAALILLAGMLGAHGIWTQEYRWQQICLHMLSSKDYWHPYLDGHPYYDKPLLTYWLILLFSKLTHGEISNTILRLPSVCAGLITLGCTYWLGSHFANRKVARLACWLLLTTFYFVFWARVASADMWNLAAILLCVVYFFRFENQAQRNFCADLGFFILLALSGLLKGLIAPVLVFILLLPSLWRDQLWQSFFNFKSIVALLIAIAAYVAPFMISSATSSSYQENGLVEVFRENVLRFFQPFDHEGPWWTYFVYAPAYTAPWCLLLLVAPLGANKNPLSRIAGEGGVRASILNFFTWSILRIFLFLSLSGSRRSYYIIPIMPFIILWLADFWQKRFGENELAGSILAWLIGIMYVLLCVIFLIIQPWYYQHHG